MTEKIVHASIGDDGKVHGGKAGDQTGKEVCIRSWWYYNWNKMIRCKNAAIGAKASSIAQKLANSNLVGYDQTIAKNDGRNTLYQALRKYGFDVDNYIKSGEKTEADCSSFLYAVYCCVYPQLRSNSNAPTTTSWPTLAKLHKELFEIYTASKYLKNDNNVRAGDMLDWTGYHIVMVCGNSATANDIKYFRPCARGYSSIVDALISVGAKYENKTQFKEYRKRIALANGLIKSSNSILTASVNKRMKELLEQGRLIKVN